MARSGGTLELDGPSNCPVAAEKQQGGRSQGLAYRFAHSARVREHLASIAIDLGVDLTFVAPAVGLEVDNRYPVRVLEEEIDKSFEDAIAVRYADIDFSPVASLRRSLDYVRLEGRTAELLD